MMVRAAQHVAAVEVDRARRRVEAGDRPRDEDLGAEPARLLQRALAELVARDAGREAEIVLDPRRRAGLAAGRLALDHDRAQALRGAVHGGGEAGRPAADDDRVVLRGGGARLQPEQLGDVAAAAGRTSVVPPPARSAGSRSSGGSAPPQRSAASARVRRQPVERDLVALEEAAQVGAGGVPALPDARRARLRRLGGDALAGRRCARARARRPSSRFRATRRRACSTARPRPA